MQPVRTAVVGTGNIARIHVRALRSVSGVEVVAGADIDGDRVAAFVAEHGIADAYTGLEPMLDGSRPDLVHVCTPPGLHHRQVLTSLQGGASVVVEKPPALSVAEMEDLAGAEKASGPWVATVFQHRFGSGAQRVRELMAAGTLGRPLLAVCHTTWFRPQSYFDLPWRGTWDSEGGGPTMGHGIHQMDLLCALFGEWTQVSAIARQQARTMETEDLSLAHVEFANGAVASVVNSVLSPREESYLRFDFERATVELTHLYGYGDDGWRITPAPGCDGVLDAWEHGPSGRSSGHAAQFAEVVSALRDGHAPPVTTGDALQTMQLVAGVYASAFQRRGVRRDELGPGSPFHARMDGDGARW